MTFVSGGPTGPPLRSGAARALTARVLTALIIVAASLLAATAVFAQTQDEAFRAGLGELREASFLDKEAAD